MANISGRRRIMNKISGRIRKPINVAQRSRIAANPIVVVDEVDSVKTNTIRKNFPESWIFDSIMDAPGYNIFN